MHTEAVIVKCDRCGSFVAGVRSDIFTENFYDVTGEPWSRYGGKGERIVCDPCMFDDPAYREDYGYPPIEGGGQVADGPP